MDIIDVVKGSYTDLKSDRSWLGRIIAHSGDDILERYEACFGKQNSLENIIKKYPYSPIPAKNKEEFRQNCAQIILENLDGLNALLGTKYSVSGEDISSFLKVGILERITGERHDPSWLYTILFYKGNGAYYDPRTGNICFQNKKNAFATPVERMDSIPHEMCHKILEEENSPVSFNDQLDEGISIYSQKIINGKYSAKVDLDTAITCFNCLDYGASLADEEKRRATIKRKFRYFKPFPNLSEKDRKKRKPHGEGYATVLYAADNYGENIIREIVASKMRSKYL